jgi:hypothetical protein
MKYIGVDPGKEGAIVVLNESHCIVEKSTFPLIGKEIDVIGVSNILEKYKEQEVRVGIENVHAIFGASASATFSFGYNCGLLEGILASYKLPYQKFQPKEWQKYCFTGIPVQKKQTSNRTDTKLMAQQAVRRLFPNSDFRMSDRCKNVHSGIVDAALIAYYTCYFNNKK